MTGYTPRSVLVRFARFYATVKHAGQLYGGLPYTHHLAAVAAAVERWYQRVAREGGIREETLVAAAWLHDVMEDCGVRRVEIAELFGEDVAALVDAVTNEPGPNRRTRAAVTYPRIRAVPGATFLKLADRIANVEAGGPLVAMYRKEYEDFRFALYTGAYASMWEYLDTLMRGDAT